MSILDLEDKYSSLKNLYENGRTTSKIYHNFYEGLQKKIEFLDRKNKQSSQLQSIPKASNHHKNFLKGIQEEINNLKGFYKRR